MFPQKGESVPILRFDGFSSEWKEKTFGDIFNLITDYVANGSFKSIRDNVKKYDTCNYAYMIRIADFNNNFKGPFIYTDVDGYNYLSKSKLNPNDLIMSNVGYVGKTFKVPQLDKPMTLAPNSILLRSSNYDIDFMYHLMNVDIIQYKIKINSSTGAQEKINKTDFKNISLFIPSYKEQKNISRLLLKLDNIINHQDNKLLSLKALKNAYLQKLFC
ncbi:type I R/M system specificity subunit [Apilactobacillus micheneri]|nr:type I R/M system specificity subunit [Apilactobacillus micheneri]TPR52579.1 type I R/M system specificity subunit [Apilactobacillus micheneri]